jgi:beta-glucosidase-like glycosyl hydrolase
MIMPKYRESETQTRTGERKKKIAQLVIARLEGRDVHDRFPYYENLVRQGIGGFIVFGGELKGVRRAIRKLQRMAEIPLFIASDLEQGLGQQISGGTTFPPAMAIASAINTKDRNDRALLKKGIHCIAGEAEAVGINVIFSPVLDINTNPENPIICTRAFSGTPDKVTWFGREFIRGFQSHGLIACAKHFPGHGDTDRDSHRELPVVRADKKRLFRIELFPFIHAVKAGVRMIMVGHLKVPALDKRYAASLSSRIITGLLKEKMGFTGLIVTDAMNMHAVSKDDLRSERKACASALKAGSDILLHPDRPEELIDYISSQWRNIETAVNRSYKKVTREKKRMIKSIALSGSGNRIGIRSSSDTALELARKSIRTIPAHPRCITGKTGKTGKGGNMVILLIDDDNTKSGNIFTRALLRRYPKARTFYMDNKSRGKGIRVLQAVKGKILIAAAFSRVSAWKGRSGLSGKLVSVLRKSVEASRTSVVTGFCCPYALYGIKADITIEAYSGEEFSQKAAAEKVCSL